MSDKEDEFAGEAEKPTLGEAGESSPRAADFTAEVVIYKRLTYEEASRCLNMLGKDETGMRYAYLKITATDRQLTDVSVVLSFKHVLFVEVGENLLTFDTLQVLAAMPYLIMLNAEGNRINSAAFDQMSYLQVLKLSRNLVLDTKDVDQPALEYLGLNHNQIYLSQFESDRLEQLKQLELRGNFLTDMSGSYPASLEALYLAENRIKELKPCADLRRLTVLHLRENYIRKLDDLGDLLSLIYLNLRKNKITKFRQFRKLARLPKLETLIVLGNPFYGEEELPGEDDEDLDDEEEKEDIARIPLLVLLPQLKRINKGPVTAEEREEVAEIREEKLEEIMAEESSEDEAPTTTGYTTEEDDL